MNDTAPSYFYVETPQARFTFIGLCRPDPQDIRRVLLCSLAGVPLLSVEARHVSPSSEEETAARIAADARHAQGIRGN